MNVLFDKPAKCPFCPVHFLSSDDLDKHLVLFGREIHEEKVKKMHSKIESGSENETTEGSGDVWRKSTYGSEFGREMCSVENDQKLVLSLGQEKEIRMGKYRYWLSGNGLWILREPAL